MPAGNRYDAYFGFYVLGVFVFLLSLLAGWLETPYAVFFFLAGLNLMFTTEKPQTDINHSTVTHYEVYSRDNVVNYILAATIVVEAIIYFIIPISKPIVIFALWTLNVYAYPRFIAYFSQRLGKQLVTGYLGEQLPELKPEQISGSVSKLNSAPKTTAADISREFKFSEELGQRLIVLYHKYLENNEIPKQS